MTAVLGILGGAFDPIHYGHLELARETMEGLDLAAVRLIPTGDPPHRAPPVATAGERLAMVKLAIADYRGLEVDSREVERPGRSFTVLTLEELRAEDPSRPLALILGADAFLGLPSWHRWLEIMDLAHIVIVARPGTAFNGKLPLHLVREWEHRYTSDPHALSATPAGVFIRQPITPQAISASTIRAALARGELTAVRSLLPAAVLAYIERNRLYGFNRLYGSRQDAT
jgi:nicotinate-nucleotide adenylyltransferase